MNTTPGSDTFTKMCRMIKLTKEEILKGYKWRGGLIPLTLSKHAQRRVEERVDGEFPIVPTMLRITEKNICSGRANGKRLISVKVKIDYKTDKWMYLIVCPNSGVVKTLYINYKDAKKNTIYLKSPNTSTEVCCEEEVVVQNAEKTVWWKNIFNKIKISLGSFK